MARIRMVTRTVSVANCDVVCVNMDTRQVETHFVSIPSVENEHDALLKACKKALNSSCLMVVEIDSVSYEEKLYGMTEENFIAWAEVLPPRSKTEDSDTE